MFQDIAFPQNNEKEFIEVALRLGTKALIFVYYFQNQKSFEEKKKEISEIRDINAEIGVLLDEKNINKIHVNDDYVFSKNPSKSLVENRKTYILYDFEIQERNDFLHHRNSGLNQVLCHEMKDKDKILGFSFSTLLNSKQKGQTLGRMQQNARFAKKYKLSTIAASFAKKPFELRAEHEILAFKKIIGYKT